MPLITSSFQTLAADLKAAPSKEVYVLFTGAKNEEGESWCPPCNRAAPDVKRILEEGDSVYALSVPVEIADFDTACWPQKEWALLGVPVVYRVVNGEPAGHFMNDGSRFGEELEQYILGEEKYEAWLEEKEGDRYADGATRWEWAREDFDRLDAEAKQNKEREEGRDKIRAAQAEKRKAAKGANGAASAAESKVNGSAPGAACGVTCSA